MIVGKIVGSVVATRKNEKLIGSKLSIHPMLVLISTYVGLCVFGVFGFFLGPVAGLLIAEIYKASEEG